MNVDTACQEFCKWVIALNLPGGIVYVLWGTDTAGEQIDKLLLNEHSDILSFSSVVSMMEHVRTKPNKTFTDQHNYHQWITIDGHEPDVVYDLIAIIALLHQPAIGVLTLTKEELMHLLGFYNLCGDYAYQTGNVAWLEKLAHPQLKIFFDYAYDTHFWKSDERGEEITEAVEHFDQQLFVERYMDILRLFTEAIVIPA
jgi:hypothetical protein